MLVMQLVTRDTEAACIYQLRIVLHSVLGFLSKKNCENINEKLSKLIIKRILEKVNTIRIFCEKLKIVYNSKNRGKCSWGLSNKTVDQISSKSLKSFKYQISV